MVDTITGSTPRYTRRRRAEVRAAWVAARARNTLRHPMRLATICGSVFVVALVLLVLAPRGARQASRQIAPLSAQWRDTIPLLRTLDTLTRRVAVAESVVAARRALARRPPPLPASDTLSTAEARLRDSLIALETQLAGLVLRAEGSPLPQSYRAIGQSPVLREDPRVRILMDSLAEVERAREELASIGGVDPIFVSLTAKVTAIGRSIQALAEEHHARLRSEITAIQPAPVARPIPVTIDTVGPLAQRDRVAAVRDSAAAALLAARDENAEIDRRLREARAQANVLAPPIAILAAALVIGAMVGFATALLIELRDPRVSDLQEAERVTGARVIAVVVPRVIPPERARRRADRDLPPLLDPTSDAYRLLASHLTVSGSPAAVVVVTGDVAAVTGTIAANIGAVSANEARTTLLVDADVLERPVASVLRIRPSQGIDAVLDGRTDLAAAAVQAPVGRDRWLDVVTNARRRRGGLTPPEADVLRTETARAARYYDLTLVVVPLDQAHAVRPTPDVLLCVHVAHSPVATLRSAVAALRDRGARIIGLVLWKADAPNLDPPWTIEQWLALGDRRSQDGVTGAHA